MKEVSTISSLCRGTGLTGVTKPAAAEPTLRRAPTPPSRGARRRRGRRRGVAVVVAIDSCSGPRLLAGEPAGGRTRVLAWLAMCGSWFASEDPLSPCLGRCVWPLARAPRPTCTCASSQKIAGLSLCCPRAPTRPPGTPYAQAVAYTHICIGATEERGAFPTKRHSRHPGGPLTGSNKDPTATVQREQKKNIYLKRLPSVCSCRGVCRHP